MAATRSLNILDDLPKFSGNPVPGEDLGPARRIDVKSFFRLLDGHIDSHQITDNATKVRLLNSLIEPNRGDAAGIIGCYSGKRVPYESIRDDFIACYPNFEVSDFRVAARKFLSNQFHDPEHDLTKLENQSRAVVDSYLGRDEMRQLRLGPHSIVTEPPQVRRADEEGDHSQGPPQPPPRPQHPQAPTIPLAEVLQNLLMHLMMATGLSDQIYKQLTKVTPALSSIKFMATAINCAKKEKALAVDPKKTKPTAAGGFNEVLYSIKEENKSQKGVEKKCYTCGRIGHFARDCRVKTSNYAPNAQKERCSYCKLQGHSTKECRKRQRNGIPYCINCGRLQHLEKACRSNCGNCNRKGHTRVNCRIKPDTRGQNYREQTGKRNYQVHHLEETPSEDTPDYEYEGNEDSSD